MTNRSSPSRRPTALAQRLLRRARQTASALWFDRRRGIDTADPVDLDRLGLADEHRVEYTPSGWWDLRRALRRAHVMPDDVFLDLGSGKGRIVLQAARYPFKRVIGVELSPQLNAIAARNVGALRSRLRCQIDLVTADVTDYRVPDDVTIVYLYNPFSGPVFQAAAQALIASFDRRPRRLRLLYQAPREHAYLASTGRFRLVRTATAWRPTAAWAQKTAINVYELTAPREPVAAGR